MENEDDHDDFARREPGEEAQRSCIPLDFIVKLFHIEQRNINHKQRAKRCPIVTLFFDDLKNVTIACLSRKCKALEVYLQCRVAQRSALQRSPLYYELDGYVRDNFVKIRRQKGFYPESIVVAMGALKASDNAQRKGLMEDRLSRLQKHHGKSLDHHTSNDLLERALDIARLHRLEDDLDVISIYCMRLTTKTFGKIAARLAKNRLDNNTALLLSPHVDGTLVSGYSKFVRGESSRLVRATENGRTVEYQKCNDIAMVPSIHFPGILVPRHENTSTFAWQCEEIALANLHRWWGDIVVRDYVGHKMALSWLPGLVDSLPSQRSRLPLATVRLEACPDRGHQMVMTPLIRIHLQVTESEARTSHDDATTSYKGSSNVQQVELQFPCLVRAAARAALDEMEKRKRVVRPLLDHEADYLRILRDASKFGLS